jgi:UDP-glucose 4-epimerase
MLVHYDGRNTMTTRGRSKGNRELELGRAAFERIAGRAPRTVRGRTVLVTGVREYWGGRVMHALEREGSIGELLGMDLTAPPVSFARMEFVQMGLRSPFIMDMLRNRKVDTVVHLDRLVDERGRERMFEANVLGTRHMLAACQDAGVRRLIVCSSTAVYGASSDHPNFIPETYGAKARTRDPVIRDMVESEADYREFLTLRVERPHLTVLRFAPIIGPTAPSAMNRFLKQPTIPCVMGYDPLLQFIHEDDVVTALVQATLKDVSGAINVAADRVLPLTRVAALLGKKLDQKVLPLVPAAQKLVNALPFSKRPILPLEYLRFLCNGETRKMKSVLDFTPSLDARAAVESIARPRGQTHTSDNPQSPEYAEYIQRCLNEVLETDEDANA